jgi:hypothetical protein
MSALHAATPIGSRHPHMPRLARSQVCQASAQAQSLGMMSLTDLPSIPSDSPVPSS